MRAKEAIIAWTPTHREPRPTSGQVKVGGFIKEGDRDWTKPFTTTGGAIYRDRRNLSGEGTVAMLFVDFHTLVVRDGIDPQVAHEAFLAIDEYRLAIAPDVPGADQE